VGVAGHLTIGRRARVAAQSGVMGDLEPGVTVFGTPARGNRDFLRSVAASYRLAEIVDDLEELVRRDKHGDG
jgi:UDP-3-O-[3-hydroxymyristoyl] glucosamine N-acyltransferase